MLYDSMTPRPKVDSSALRCKVYGLGFYQRVCVHSERLDKFMANLQ